MVKRYCDKCGKELPKKEGYGFKITKSYKVSLLHRDIFTNMKQTFDDKEYCWNCFYDFIHLYEDFKKDK